MDIKKKVQDQSMQTARIVNNLFFATPGRFNDKGLVRFEAELYDEFIVRHFFVDDIRQGLKFITKMYYGDQEIVICNVTL